MPSSARTLITPPISPSVFFEGSVANSLTRRQSGRIDEKIFACFTCPHIITSVMPSCLQMSMSLLSWPSEIQWHRAASDSTSFGASSWMAMTVTSIPNCRALSSASSGNRPLPAIKPYRISGADPPVRGRPPGRPSLIHQCGSGTRGSRADQGVCPTNTSLVYPAFGRPNELDQLVHFRAGRNLGANPVDGLRGIQLCPRQQPDGGLQRLDHRLV